MGLYVTHFVKIWNHHDPVTEQIVPAQLSTEEDLTVYLGYNRMWRNQFSYKLDITKHYMQWFCLYYLI